MKIFQSVLFATNTIILLFFVYIISEKGGLDYLLNKTGLADEEAIKASTSWYYKNYRPWKERVSLFLVSPDDENEIIFLGDSITEGGNWGELFSNPYVKNRGIGGDNTEGLLERLDEVTESSPEKIFINIGINDIALGTSIENICLNYEAIVKQIKQTSPSTKLYIQSVLPTNSRPERNNNSIQTLNERLKILAAKYKILYIDLHKHFIDSSHSLDMKYSFDGLHLNGEGYLVWKNIVEKYVVED